MKFNLKKPCKDCPFVKGSSTNTTLAEGRLDGIVHDILHDASFVCHKTLEKEWNEQEHCAGALIYLERQKRPNQIMRIAERIGLYNYKQLASADDVNLID